MRGTPQPELMASEGGTGGEQTDLSHGLHDGELLSVDEGLEDEAEGGVDVIVGDVLTQVETGVGLSETHHRLDVAHRDGHRARRRRLTPKLSIGPRHLVRIHLVQLRVHTFLRIYYVLLQ